MKISLIFSIAIMSALLCSQVSFASNRTLCKRYYSNMPLQTCIGKQRAAKRKLFIAHTREVRWVCIEATRRYDKKFPICDYIAAEKCAREEQKRQDKTYDSRKPEH